jgi:hypothetical protein
MHEGGRPVTHDFPESLVDVARAAVDRALMNTTNIPVGATVAVLRALYVHGIEGASDSFPIWMFHDWADQLERLSRAEIEEH